MCSSEQRPRSLPSTNTKQAEKRHELTSEIYIARHRRCQPVSCVVVVRRQGRRFVPAGIGERLSERIPLSDLTQCETEVLALLARGQSNQEIADTLRIAEKTVRIHGGPYLQFMDTGNFPEVMRVAKAQYEFKDGFLRVPAAPGLGVEVDETAIRRADRKG